MPIGFLIHTKMYLCSESLIKHLYILLVSSSQRIAGGMIFFLLLEVLVYVHALRVINSLS